MPICRDPEHYDEIFEDPAKEEARLGRLREDARLEAVWFIMEMRKRDDDDFEEFFELVYDYLNSKPVHDEAAKRLEKERAAKKPAASSALSPAQAVFDNLAAMNRAYLAGLKAGRSE